MSETRKPVASDVLHEIASFLYREARLLDEQNYREWLGLLTEDVHYSMPTVENRFRRNGPSPESRMAFFDDGRVDLERRVTRFECESAWPEDPPTRHFHLVTNIEAYDHDAGYEVFSAVVNYRSRGDHDEMTLFGRREDLLRSEGGELKLARRLVHTSQSLLAARNLNTFL